MVCVFFSRSSGLAESGLHLLLYGPESDPVQNHVKCFAKLMGPGLRIRWLVSRGVSHVYTGSSIFWEHVLSMRQVDDAESWVADRDWEASVQGS